ncbi:hypothetical protein LZ198_15265 [Myxococcus sp. K15C18031901]|uniref:hypothetical protein n=1 Tax=Myxococcus dinghuensis TaxID=2906761 RepID=UPI0020A7B1AE|nr:hypothetical protein [Myxococcus dinghuensis]MCP3100228.1 hypothetical protein [Myxococcus dinghuensis]
MPRPPRTPPLLPPSRLLAPLLALLALPASAQETPPPEATPKPPGFAVGARLAYGLPFGDSAAERPLPLEVDGAIASQVDVSYFFTPHAAVDLQGQYGIARYPLICGDETCRGSVLRLGVGLSYHFPSNSFWNHWLGAGVGVERFATTEDSPLIGKSTQVNWGLEFLNLQMGIDFKVLDALRIGPYVAGTLGTYLQHSTHLDGQEPSSTSIDQKAVHFWLQPGVRLQVRL